MPRNYPLVVFTTAMMEALFPETDSKGAARGAGRLIPRARMFDAGCIL